MLGHKGKVLYLNHTWSIVHVWNAPFWILPSIPLSEERMEKVFGVCSSSWCSASSSAALQVRVRLLASHRCLWPRGGASLCVHVLPCACCRPSVVEVRRSQLRVHLTPSSTSSIKSTTTKWAFSCTDTQRRCWIRSVVIIDELTVYRRSQMRRSF